MPKKTYARVSNEHRVILPQLQKVLEIIKMDSVIWTRFFRFAFSCMCKRGLMKTTDIIDLSDLQLQRLVLACARYYFG